MKTKNGSKTTVWTEEDYEDSLFDLLEDQDMERIRAQVEKEQFHAE